MADEKPSLHIDTDWKKQAQEEKRKLVEAAAKAPPAPPASPAAARGTSAGSGAPTARRRPGGRDLPPASFSTLVQSIMTQVLYYLGDIASPGAAPSMDLDLAKSQIDTLNVLEDKTKNNLSADEQNVLDAALYETRTRFVSVASQLLGP